jgi:hypothetical protein
MAFELTDEETGNTVFTLRSQVISRGLKIPRRGLINGIRRPSKSNPPGKIARFEDIAPHRGGTLYVLEGREPQRSVVIGWIVHAT